jgi:hypothetical protein
VTVNIALRRRLWQLDYFTEGSIPDALFGVPNGGTPDQIRQFQDCPLPNPPPHAGEGRVGAAQAEAEGLEPTKEWVKDLIDEILADEFASADLELAWLDEDDGDPETVLEGRLKVGALTLNEMRDALGLDPYDNAAANRPMVLTASCTQETKEMKPRFPRDSG